MMARQGPAREPVENERTAAGKQAGCNSGSATGQGLPENEIHEAQQSRGTGTTEPLGPARATPGIFSGLPSIAGERRSQLVTARPMEPASPLTAG